MLRTRTSLLVFLALDVAACRQVLFSVGFCGTRIDANNGSATTPILSATVASIHGKRIYTINRKGAGSIASIDYLTITAIP